MRAEQPGERLVRGSQVVVEMDTLSHKTRLQTCILHQVSKDLHAMALLGRGTVQFEA
jgi:hypothetical protein